MSPCPKCGQERGLHLRLVVPWRPTDPVVIDHQCRDRKCSFLWAEVVHSPEAALKSALENRGTAPLSGDLFGEFTAKFLEPSAKGAEVQWWTCPKCGTKRALNHDRDHCRNCGTVANQARGDS